MDNLSRLRQASAINLALFIFGQNILIVGLALLLHIIGVPAAVIVGIVCAVGLTSIVFVSLIATKKIYKPLELLQKIILDIKPGDTPPPEFGLGELKEGRQLLTSLLGQIYELSSQSTKIADQIKAETLSVNNNFVAQNLPLPIIILDNQQNIVFANQLAADYVGIAVPDLEGKNLYMAVDMAFPNKDTFDIWLKEVSTAKATAIHSWERVKLNVRDGHPPRLFDMAAYYNRDNSQKLETILVLFDHTKAYSQDDQAVSFVALTVHELRTPLTLLKGYIEVFEEELSGNAKPELIDFMHKMRAMAEQLTDVVNNILNVARVDDDQMELKLQSEDWSTVLKTSIEQISLRAKVRGITLKCRIQTNLPPVGIDRISIREVISNIIDNALKYSGESKVIEIETYLTEDGLVETTFRDYGVGIPSSIVSNLFTKFYRDHRNRAQIGGTGLGLYLSKAIVDAHGGSIWVKSKEGEGSTFGFTVLPFDQLQDPEDPDDDQAITRSPHGWIKNHSLYRR